MDVLIYANGAVWAEPGKPHKRFMGTCQKDCLIIGRKI